MDEDISGDKVARSLREAREAKRWTIDEAMFQARMQYPQLKIGRGQIVRYEKGAVDPHRRDVGVLVALADLYDVELAAVDPEIVKEFEDRLEAMTALARPGSPCTPTQPPRGPVLVDLAA